MAIHWWRVWVKVHVHGSGGVPIPGDVQETGKCSTEGHGLVGVVVMAGDKKKRV